MKNIRMISDWLRVALLKFVEMSCSMACSAFYRKKKIVMSSKRKRSVPSIKDKNEDADDIVFQMICKSVVSRLNVVFFI